MLTLDAAALSPYVGDTVPYSAIVGANPVDTFPLGYGDSPVATPTTLTIAADTTQPVTFTLPVGTLRVDSVTYGDQTYTAATAPPPQPGEFLFNSLTGQITIAPLTSFTAGLSLLIHTVDPNAVLVEYLLTTTQTLPDIFFKYEIKGAIAWSCDWEGQPSGTFELLCDWATADALENELIPKVTFLDIFGIGFQVNTLTIVKRSPLEAPNLEATVTVQLRSKWEAYLEESVVLDVANGSTGGGRTIRGDTTVQAIAAKVGAVTVLPANRIQAPRKAGEEEVVSLQEVFEGNLRHNGCFGRYSSADAIEAVRLDAVQVHNIAYADLYNTELEIQVNANPRALDFKNGRLEWGERVSLSSTFLEDTQGNSATELGIYWRQKPVSRQVTVTGSDTLNTPPTNIKDLIDPSFVFDNGGPVKEQTITSTENGAIVYQVYTKKGFVAVAHLDLYTRSGNTWSPRSASIISALWRTIEYWVAAYAYDNDTGYLGAITITGWRLVRLQNESNNESLDAAVAHEKASAGSDPAKQAKALAKLQAYEFQAVPLTDNTRFAIQKFRQNYGDIPPQPTEEQELLVPEFNVDGSLNPIRFTGNETTLAREEINGIPYLRIKQQIPVPGYADPCFAVAEVSKKMCFLSRYNPDSTAKKPLPNLTTGEDKELERRVYVGDYRNQDRSGSFEGESYLQYERLQSQKDASFARTARETTEEQQKGRPGEHTRKEMFYEKVDPTAGEKSGDEFEYVISTTEVDDDRIVGETASYPYASTFDQAIVGLQTDLEITNTRDTKTTSIELRHALALREGDIINLEGHGQWRVLSYSKSLAIMAPGVIQPGRMGVELGRVVTAPPIAVTKKLIPKPPEDDSDTQPIEPGALTTGIIRGNTTGA